jgi:hypothetical protein
MSVSRGHALVWSAALHTLGLGVAAWATHGLYREPSSAPELHVTRAFALHFLTLTPPKPREEPRPAHKMVGDARLAPQPHGPLATTPVAGPPEPDRAAVAPRDGNAGPEPPRSSLPVQELSPGATVTVVGKTSDEGAAELPALARLGLDRAAALASPTGSACPELPLPTAGGGGELAVAVALVVDASGKVDPSALRVVESPGRPPTDRRFYPRIYVVGARAGRGALRVDRAAYDSAVTLAVTRHMTRLTFHPALKQGRPVRSTVLIACHQTADG